MNWTECSVVEVVPGKLSGAPVIVHSGVRPDDLVANREEGPEWQAENYTLPVDTVRIVLGFHERKLGRKHTRQQPVTYAQARRRLVPRTPST